MFEIAADFDSPFVDGSGSFPLHGDGHPLVERLAGRVEDCGIVLDLDGDVKQPIPRVEGESEMGLEGIVESLVFDPSGKVLASLGYDGVIRLWDVVNGGEIGHRRLHEGGFLSACFTPDGKAIVTGGREEIAFWDVSKGDEPAERWPSELVRQMEFSSDGKFLLTADRATDVRLWSTDNRSIVESFDASSLGATRLKFIPDGICWASIDGETRVHFWMKKSASPPVEYLLPGNHDFVLAFSKEANQLYAGSQSGYIQSLEIKSGKLGRRFDIGGRITCLEVSPSGRILAFGLNKGILGFLDTETGQVLSSRRGHPDGISALAFSRDGRLLASGSNDSSIKIWDVPGLNPTRLASLP